MMKCHIFKHMISVGWLCFTYHRHRGHLETAPPITVHCEAQFLHRSHHKSNPGPLYDITLPLRHAGSYNFSHCKVKFYTYTPFTRCKNDLDRDLDCDLDYDPDDVRTCLQGAFIVQYNKAHHIVQSLLHSDPPNIWIKII